MSYNIGNREVLTADRTYYVDAVNGLDTHDGRSAARAFKTITAAVTYVAANVAFGGGSVSNPMDNDAVSAPRLYIQLADGTYSEEVRLPAMPGGVPILLGNTASPGNVLIQPPAAAWVGLHATEGAVWYVKGVKASDLNAPSINLFYASEGGTLFLDNIALHVTGQWAGPLRAFNHSAIYYGATPLVIDGTQAGYFFDVSGNSQLIMEGSITISTAITVNGAMVSCYNGSHIDFSPSGITGGANVTGKRFDASSGGDITTHGGGLSFVPGTIAGTTDASSSYDGIPTDATIPQSAVTGLVTALANAGKELLTASRTYYVNGATGLDTNNGRTAGTAFATIQRAVDEVVDKLDLSGLMPTTYEYNLAERVTISVANGTYSGTVILRPVTGSQPGNIVIEGNPLVATDVSVTGPTIVPTPYSSGADIQGYGFLSLGGYWAVSGFKMDLSAEAYQYAFYVDGSAASGYFAAGHMRVIGNNSYVFNAVNGGYAAASSPVDGTSTIRLEGSFQAICYANEGSKIDIQTTFDLEGTPALGRFVDVEAASLLVVYSMSLTGTGGTGQRYYASQGSTIITFGGGASFFPGSTAGSVDASSSYDGVTGAVAPTGGGGRELITDNRTYYVNATTGSDSNTGLTSGTAFQTIQRAVDEVCQKLDFSILTKWDQNLYGTSSKAVTIQVADGTYHESVTFGQLVGNGGQEVVRLLGNIATPQNVMIVPPPYSATSSTINVVTGVCMSITAGAWLVDGFGFDMTYAADGGYYIAIQCYPYSGAAYLELGSLYFKGLHSYCLDIGGPASVYPLQHGHLISGSLVDGIMSFEGTFQRFAQVTDGGRVALGGRLTFVSGPIAFGNEFVMARGGNVFASLGTITGSATGKRFTLTNSSEINTGGSGLSYLPGSTAGTMDASSSYDGVQGAGTIPNTSTLPVVSSAASAASPLVWNSSLYKQYSLTAQSGALTINADAATAPLNGDRVLFRIKDNGTACALTWTTGSANSFRPIGVTLPATTVASKTMYVSCVYNAADSRWDVLMINQEA